MASPSLVDSVQLCHQGLCADRVGAVCNLCWQANLGSTRSDRTKVTLADSWFGGGLS